MYKKITGKKLDYSSMTSCPNIDTMCDVLVVTQQEMGQEPSMQEASYDRSGNKIRRFKRSSDGKLIDTRTGEILKKDEPRDIPYVKRIGESDSVRVMEKKKPCSECPVKHEEKKEKKHLGFIERGFDNFYNGFFGDEEDDDNDEYICEYCTELGYSSKYKAHICDNCTKCETCDEYQRGSCDGCTYSRTRTGRLYSESLSLDQIVDPDDLELLEESKENVRSERRKFGGFSILNY